MKTKRMRAVTLAMVFAAVFCAADSSASITDVNIAPSLPTQLEAISIITLGIEGSGAVVITDSNFQREDTSLELNIFITLGYYGVITPWSHSEVIGTLPANNYDLAVTAHYSGAYVGTDTYLTSFEVIPEPATLFLLGLGGLLLKRGRK